MVEGRGSAVCSGGDAEAPGDVSGREKSIGPEAGSDLGAVAGRQVHDDHAGAVAHMKS
jgi:hypothetical protein